MVTPQKIYLETPRLILRDFTLNDANLLHRLDSDPDVMRYINGGTPTPLSQITDETLPRFVACNQRHKDFGYFAALEKPSERFIGWFLFRPSNEKHSQDDEIEIGYRLMKSAWGKGLATEGSIALLRKGFEQLGVPRVFAIALPENVASIRVMNKIGLTYQTTFTLDSEQVVVKHSLDRDEFDRMDT